jgi:hypothetical protein
MISQHRTFDAVCNKIEFSREKVSRLGSQARGRKRPKSQDCISKVSKNAITFTLSVQTNEETQNT